MRRTAVLLMLFAFAVGAGVPSVAATRPNVILMMADDLASNDLSCYGGKRIDTPRLDKLAEQGLRLTSFYAGNPVCSPSRMALLSGSYPARLGWRWGVMGFGMRKGTGMSPQVYTIAEAFRDAGYRTALSGKWHVGSENMAPEHQGFDSAYYILLSNNQSRDMYRDGRLVRQDWDNRLLTETFAEEAIRVIHEENDKPFFLYVPWSAPHFPADPHPDWHGKSGQDKSGKYTDVVEELDHRIGQILDALDQAGKAENTIVIFASDNGREQGQEAKHPDPLYRGIKWQSLEGGTRVPFIVRWPKQVASDTTNNAMMAAIDVYPTLAAMCEVPIDLPAGAQKMDGIDCKAMLLGLKGSRHRHELLYWHGKGQATAIRMGDWKLFFNAGEKDPPLTDGPVLYHLPDDPKETTDLSAQHPDRVKRMLARAKQFLTEVYTNQTPIGTRPGVEPSDQPLKAEDVWGNWID